MKRGRLAYLWRTATTDFSQAPITPALTIRPETSADIDAIRDVTVAVFATLAISGHTEQFIVAALRAAKALAVALVAEIDGRVVGHIAFSPVTISDGTANWYGLGQTSGDGATLHAFPGPRDANIISSSP